ncbi:hypothetical protein F5I97DRAFT_2059395 [Phlebopus sp. FC_14]|nr:hypothetical protein F5I97DRAFT_2059395 [Phlebopus sp. FC_14]
MSVLSVYLLSSGSPRKFFCCDIGATSIFSYPTSSKSDGPPGFVSHLLLNRGMEPIRSQDQQQKDYLAFLFPDTPAEPHRTQDSHQNDVLNGSSLSSQRAISGLSNFTGLPSTSFNNGPLDLMSMGNLTSMQGIDASHSALPSTSTFTPQMLLEQQYKLTQLHQLQQLQNQIQNQIFQQQLALISGQTNFATHDSNTEPQREQVSAFSGLPTPISSTEIRPLPNPDFLNRMNSPYTNSQQDIYNSHGLENVHLPSPQEPAGSSQFLRHPGSASAPANIVFHTSPSFALPSPSDLDIDISPLTSPWLEASQQQPMHPRPNKRTTSPNEEESGTRTSKKRSMPATTAAKKPARNVKSATSTPLLRSSTSRTRRNSTAMETDSPSPVDLSMPPPAPPGANSSPGVAPRNTLAATSTEDVHITPVTPASIMNLGRLGISSSLTPTSQTPRVRSETGKDTVKHKAPIEGAPLLKGTRKGTLPLISPGPKPILPAAGSPASLNLGSSALSQPATLTRKSHKDAEQKRRDSLKAAYDDLRVLLPPIPLPSDENFPDEPILPGALPPRGPPKAGGDGPNKGVSKLQLLRCGNDYIRQLKGRVDRRDAEISKLRQEVLRLRTLAGDDAQKDGEFIDLEFDLDAVEIGNASLGQSMADEDGDDGDG